MSDKPHDNHTENPENPGYTLGGIWINALPRCGAHRSIEPCAECNYWIGAGY